MKPKKVNIIGAGFSGLVQAFHLTEAGIPCRILEKQSRWGGLLGSKKAPGFLFEQAANAFIANRELERIASKIGVVLVAKTPAARRRFIFRDGQMRRWPLGFSEAWPLLPFLLKKKWRNPQYAPTSDETLEQWGLRILGKGATQYLLEPAMQGIYAATLDQLDARLILDSLGRTNPRGTLRGSVSPSGGMQDWVDKMATYLVSQGVDIDLSSSQDFLKLTEPTIFATDLRQLRQWANEQKIPFVKSLLETRSASLTSVTLAYRDSRFRLQEGFGCLFPRREGFNSIGVLFNHSIFPNRVQEGSSETWILNDQKMEFSQMSEMALLRYVFSDRNLLQKTEKEPEHVFINQWQEKIPLYNFALKSFLENLNQEKLPYLVVGNYLGDLGLSKILFHSKKNCERIRGGYFV